MGQVELCAFGVGAWEGHLVPVRNQPHVQPAWNPSAQGQI